jgi:O-antigen/teichoic acid export membrane protein
VFGPGYARADTGVLRLLALCALPALVTNTALSVARSQRRMGTVAGIQVAICVLVWGLSALLMEHLGITGVGAAWLVAQTATAAVLVAWPRLWLPPRRHGVHQPGGGGGRAATTGEETNEHDDEGPDGAGPATPAVSAT